MALEVAHGQLVLRSVPWSSFWRVGREFFEADRRLVHRLVQLKKAWLALLHHPGSVPRRQVFCWEYFSLLHHALDIARSEPDRADPMPTLQHIVSFECFRICMKGGTGTAAGIISTRNPVYLLGRLPHNAPLPTPRHVPLVLPSDELVPFYCYRQLRSCSKTGSDLLLFPAVDLQERTASFAPIDRVARLITTKPDPYAYARARLLARRVLLPLLGARVRNRTAPCAATVSVLDVGAGTGHVVANAWQTAVRQARGYESLSASSLHRRGGPMWWPVFRNLA